MTKTCRKCQHTATAPSFGAAAACPQCGAIYAKVEARMAQDAAAARQQQAAAAQAQQAAQSEAAQAQAREQARAARTRSRALRDGYVCTDCGAFGHPVKVTRGSLLIELILWLAFLVPGLIYSIWRLTSRYRACPTCRHPSMIPADSPRGVKLIADLGIRVG